MKAFKATNRDMTCFGIKYELNKTYKMSRWRISICRRGFHFCKKLEDINIYYSFYSKKNRFFEVEIPNNAKIIDSPEGDKSVTNKIKFIRELDSNDFKKNGIIRLFDSNENLIYWGNPNGLGEWFRYDSNDRLIYRKNPNGYEAWWEHDSNGNVIHFKTSDGYEYWQKYNSDGIMVYYKNNNGIELDYKTN